jgi:hypothetical protein
MIRAKDHKWWLDHGNLTALGYYLVNEREFSARDLQYYYEKPWKYTLHWDIYSEIITMRKAT